MQRIIGRIKKMIVSAVHSVSSFLASILDLYSPTSNDCYRIFKDREAIPFEYDKNIDASITNAVLEIICESFDLSRDAIYMLRPEDTPKAIYDSCYGNNATYDDMELECLSGMIYFASDHTIDRDRCISMPISQIIQSIASNRNNKPISESELEKILDHRYF